MTLEERKQVRNKKLGDYYDARDNRQALCGQLSDHINTLRNIVEAYDQGKLQIASPSKGISVPTQTEIETALIQCQEARDQEQRLYREALEAGVDSSRMPSQSKDQSNLP